MGNIHQTELWHDMFVVLGTSAAALVGLLFIVTSLHLSRIINDPILHDRAFNNTCYLLIILFETLLMLMPQPLLVAGAEIVFLNLVGLSLLLRIPLRIFKNKESYRRSGGHIHRLLVFLIGLLLGLAGGVVLMKQLDWGIYLVTASSIILLTMVVYGAWLIMVGIGKMEKLTE